MKKYLLFTLLCVISITGILYASLTLQYFTAKTASDGIMIEWKTNDESGVARFEIERSLNAPDNFVNIKTVAATGNNSYYSYLDNGVTNRNSGNSIYYYRIKCVFPNSSYSYTNTISVAHSVSGIKSTWGSIKAIFR